MKKHFLLTLENPKKKYISDELSVWEYLKCEIRKFCKIFSEIESLETKLDILASKFVLQMVLNIFTVKKNLANYIKKKLTVLQFSNCASDMSRAHYWKIRQ